MSFSKRAVLFLLCSMLTVSVSVSYGQSTPSPRIFYSDLESGPNSGGQNGQGAFVTIYGQGFGATQGNSSVTIGGSPAYGYPVWSDTKITFQLGSGAITGQVAVNVSGVTSSGVPFTVRPGRIFFVATNGDDSQIQNSYSNPWRTLAKAQSSMRPGDIVYAMNGVTATGLDSSNASLAITRAGSSGNPMAIVAYPAATVTVGSETGQTYGIVAPSGGSNFWTLAGLKVRGAIQAINIAGATNWRVVGNDISCPNGNGTGACVNTSSASRIKFLGNKVHDSGSTTSPNAANYHSVQFSSSKNVEVGWNEIGNTRSCRALTFSNGSNQYGLAIHDNYIHDAVCDGLSLASVDPSRGGIAAYNNVFQHVGKGPALGGTESKYACINAASGSGSGTVHILNNTMYDCGTTENAASGAIAASVPVNVTNNIISLLAGENYITANTNTSNLSGSNDLFWGAGASPAPFSDSLNADPEFIDPANADFHTQASSPAADAGTNTVVPTAADGVRRPQGPAYDIGAYELAGGTLTNAGKLVANPSLVDLGTVTTGMSNTQSVSVSNSGTADLTISHMNVTGAGFTATGMNLPATLSPGQSTSFTVTFAPLKAGAASGSVAFIGKASNSISAVQLSGNGADAAVATVSAKALSATVAAAASPICPCSIWSPSAVPAVIDAGDGAAVELGVKIKSDVSGFITGIRYYKSSGNTGTHIGSLWTSTGTRLASATFTGETASGWQQVKFSSPVAITAGTTYVASYYAPKGHYSHTLNYFASAGTDNAPLHALRNGGVFIYGATSRFPNQTWNGSNYWVDVVFTSTSTAGTLAVSPNSLNFGNVAVGSSSAQNVTVTASTAPVTISQANVSGTGFSISGLTVPTTLAVGQSATFQVKFAPSVAGSATGTLSLTSNASNSPSVSVSGSGVSPAGTLAASPTSLNFGNVTVGGSSSPQNVTVTASTASVTISNASVSGTGFSISGLTLPTTLTAGQSATFQVKFAPTVAGSATGSLSFTSNASNSPNVSLAGTGATGTTSTSSIWSSTATPATIDSGDSQSGTLGVRFKSDASGYITGVRYYKSSSNTGTHVGSLWTSSGTLLASATFTGETATGWQQVNFSNPVAVTAGTTYVASYYTPTGHYSDNQNYLAAGVDNAPLHALPNGGVFAYGTASSFPSQTWNASNYWVDVVFTTTGGGTPASTLSASPTSLNFGGVAVGASSTQNVTVTASNSSITISQANVTGAGFSVSGLTLPKTLAAGQSATFQVKFAPTTAGSVTGTVSLVSNASNPSTNIAVSGTGSTGTTLHSATLNWNASTSTNVVGYNIYRGTQTGGAYTKVNSTAVAATTYTDSNVAAGTTYYYVVTAVNGSSQESGYSSQVSATVPTP